MGGPGCEARLWLVGGRGTRRATGGPCRTPRRMGELVLSCGNTGWSGGREGGRLVRALHEYDDFSHFRPLVRQVQEVERRIYFGHPSRLCGLCLVQVQG